MHKLTKCKLCDRDRSRKDPVKEGEEIPELCPRCDRAVKVQVKPGMKQPEIIKILKSIREGGV